MNKYLIPDVIVDSIYDIDLPELKKRNIKGIFFDIDNTLAPFGSREPTKEISEYMNALKEKGFVLGIVSNAKSERSEGYVKGCEMAYAGIGGKPGTKIYYKTAALMGLRPEEIAAVGDQIFTDIKGGNKFGAYTILVRPIDLRTEPWYTKIKRGFERNILRRIEKDGAK